MRYKMFSKRLSVQGEDINLIKNLLFGLIGWILVTSKQAQDLFNIARHFF